MTTKLKIEPHPNLSSLINLLSERERKEFEDLVKRVKELCKLYNEGDQDYEFFSDEIIFRFFLSNNNDAIKTSHEIQNVIKWRSSYKPYTITKKDIDFLSSIQDPCIYSQGYDEYGRPIIYIHIKNCVKRLKGNDNRITLCCYILENCIKKSTKGCVVIVDAAKLSPFDFKELKRFQCRFFKLMNNYAGFIYKCYVVNLDIICLALWYLTRKLFPSWMEKTIVFVTRKKLRKVLNKKYINRHFGGELEWENEFKEIPEIVN